MKTLKTDVIIPAYRPGEEFEKLLERLSAQKYPINKILVMNTEKKFWKETWEQEYPLVEVRHLTKEEFDHGGTRRQAAELSDAEILVFMTQDAMPADRELIGALVGALAENPQAGAAFARPAPKLHRQEPLMRVSFQKRTADFWKNIPVPLIIRNSPV